MGLLKDLFLGEEDTSETRTTNCGPPRPSVKPVDDEAKSKSGNGKGDSGGGPFAFFDWLAR